MSYVSLSFPLWGAVTQSILRPDSKAQVLANDPVPLEDLATGAHRNSFGVQGLGLIGFRAQGS